MNKKFSNSRVLRGLLLPLATAMALAPSVAMATTSTWSQTAAGTYNWTDSNWGVGSPPNAIGDTANITADFAGAQQINLNQNITLGTLTINDTGASGDSAITIAAGTSGTLTMQVATGTATITHSSSAVTSIISAPIIFNSDTVIDLGTGSSNTQGLTLSGGFSGSGNITVKGSSTSVGKNLLTLSGGSNSGYTGNWTLSGTSTSGVSATAGSGIQINADANLGSSSTTSTITVAANASPVINFDTSGGAITLNANRSIVLNSGSNLYLNALSTNGGATVAGVISGAGGITVNAGSLNRTVILTGLNTYTGATAVTSDTLQAGSTSALGNNSAVTLGATSLAKLNLNNFNNSIGSLAGGGAGQGSVTLGTATLTTGALNTSTTYAGAISGTGGFTKVGTGTQTLSGANTYTGSTTIANGNLSLTGSLATGTVTVGNGTAAVAILSGTGTANGKVVTATAGSGNVAYLAPGVNTSGTRGDFGGTGTLTLNSNLSLGTGTNLDYDLSASASSGNDQIVGGGTLTIGTALTFNFNELSTSLDTTNKYQLITFVGTAPSLSGVSFTTNLTGTNPNYSAVYSIDGGGEALDVAFAAVSSTPAAAYFNGQGADLGTFANFDTSASSGTAVSGALGNTTNVSFNANRNTTVSTATLNTALDINSVTFGTGTGIHNGMTINGTGTMTIEATTANSNTLGNGITVASGGGNNTINAAVALGNDQTWTVTDSTSTLLLGGNVSGAHMLSTAGNGVVALSNASGNTYSGGTSVGGASKLLITNTSGSATGTGSLTVARGAGLAGTGIINATSGAINLGTTGSSSVANVWVGQAVGGDTNTTSNLTLKAASGMTITNTTLTFNLNTASVGGSGTPSVVNGTGASGSGNELLVGNTAVTFSSGVTLQLNMQGNTIIAPNTPYVLFAGTGMGTGLNNSIYSGLTSGGTDAHGNIIIEGLTLSFGGAQPPAWYANSYLFLNQSGGVDDIEVEVVPEPSTWAMIVAGFGMLLGIQRLRRRQTS